MKSASFKIDSQRLLDAARENDYSTPSPVMNNTADGNVQEERKETAAEPAVSDSPYPASREPQPKSVALDRPKRERTKRGTHKELFVKNTNLKARKGRQSYIRDEFHEQIQRIVDVVGNKEVTIASYLDNVLAYHFEMFGAEISEELNERFKSSYNSNIKFEF